MLFICTICKYGHPSTNVQNFVDPLSRRQSYFCKQHLDSPETKQLVHIPWVADTIKDPSEFCVSRESLIIRENEYIAAAAKDMVNHKNNLDVSDKSNTE